MFSKLIPARKKVSPQAIRVTDLDAMVSKPVEFVLHGQVHTINPLSVQDFLEFTAKLVELTDLEKEASLTAEKLIDRYFALVKTVCKTINRKDIEDMTQQQVSMLFQVIIDSVSGRVYAEKKKMN